MANGRRQSVTSAEAFHKILETQDMLYPILGIHCGLEDVKAGRTRPASEFFAELRKRRESCVTASDVRHIRHASRWNAEDEALEG